MDNEKKFLDKAGLAKFWELICEHFVDVENHELIMADYDEKIEQLQEAVAQAADQENIQKQINTINGLIEGLEDKDDELEAKIDTEIEELFQRIVASAPEALDTLKEIADWIANDETGTAALVNRVAALEEWTPLTNKEIDAICSQIRVVTKVANEQDFSDAFLDSDVVKLSSNIALSNSIAVPAGKAVTLDLNGKELTLSRTTMLNADGGELTIANGTVAAAGRVAWASNGGKLVVEDAVISSGDVALQADGAGSELIINSGEITAQECGALVTTESTFTMNGGEITAIDNAAIMGNGTVKDGDDRGHVVINFNGGELNCGITSAGYSACGIYMPNSGELNVNGGVINVEKGCGILMRAGMLNLNAGEIHCSDNSGVEGGFVGKVGDSRVVVPCAALVMDDKANYPGLKNGDFGAVIADGVILESAPGLDDICYVSDDPSKISVVDNRA